MKKLFRWLFKRCMDCGCVLDVGGLVFERGDVCDKCFDDFHGLTVKEIQG